MANLDRPKKACFVKIRFLIVLMGVSCPICCYLSRQNLSMAMVSMVNDAGSLSAEQQAQPATAAHNHTHQRASPLKPADPMHGACPRPKVLGSDGKEGVAPKVVSYGPKYEWSSSQRSLMFEAFFWTYVIFQIPAARLAELMGAKWILTTAAAGSSVLSLASPFAASLSPYALASVRALMGVCQTALYPACYVLFTRWLPPGERAQAIPILGAGAYVGSIVTSIATGYFSEQAAYGWHYAFYMPAAACAVWSLCWVLVGTSEPREHPFVSLEELEYIESRMEQKRPSSYGTQQPPAAKKSISWRKIFTSSHIWPMVAAFLASNWAFSITLLLLPSYLNYILHIPPLKNGLINSVIYVLNVISSPVVGAVSALMVETRAFGLTRLQVRKLFQSVAVFSQTACFLSLPLIGCDTNLVLGVLYAQVVLFSFINGGEVQVPAELSLDFAGTIFAIGNCVGSSTGFLVPRVHGLMVENYSDRSQWNAYFYSASAVTATGGLIFLFFGKNDLQDFAKEEPQAAEDQLYKLSKESAFSLAPALPTLQAKRENKNNANSN